MTRKMPDDTHNAVDDESKGSSRIAYPKPLLRLEILDLSHPGAAAFLKSTDTSQELANAVHTVLTHLYPSHADDAATVTPSEHHSRVPKPPSQQGAPWPGTRSVTLVLDPYKDGVAYTTGKDIDSDHKEIHLMANYVAGVPAGRLADEMRGVLVHEMVHCWQWAAGGRANGGLIEGIADWVRLRAGLGPAHWTRRKGKDDRWDSGYAITAFFLEWLEERFGKGTVVAANAALREDGEFDADRFFGRLVGRDVGSLWREYTDGPGKLEN